MIHPVSERPRRLTYRALPVGAVALVALVAGVVVGSSSESGAERTAREFGRAWERGELARMRGLLTPQARARYRPAAFRRAYARAAATATATGVTVGDPSGADDGRVRLPVTVSTRVFGPVSGDVELPLEGDRVAWTPALAFPGLRDGEALTRRSAAPERARILARDGRALAQGPASARSSPLGAVAASIAGSVAPPEDRAERAALYSRGFPPDEPVGQTGLERIFERELAGRPGGQLRAGRTVLARVRPRAGTSVRATIDPRLQAAAATALGARLGGVAVLDARTAEVRALAGLAFSAPQPPGSTFKIVTTTAALEARAVKLTTNFPVQTHATIDGVPLENAGGEACGGSFRNSFAHSCNSVFAPLGLKVGARRLVATAERYGFNEPPTLPGQQPSTLPPASQIRTPLEVGSTAIGQFKVQATPFELASIAQTVAADGVRTRPTLRLGAARRRTRVTSPRIAATLTSLMTDVVRYGTGTSAAIPGVTVAGKTGTAELEDTRGPNASAAGNTDAWFAAFAPAARPRLAVGVMFVRAGAGGETAAPAARTVLAAALGGG